MSKWPFVMLEKGIHIKHGFAFKGEYFSNSGNQILITPGNFHEEGGFKYTPGKEKYYVGEYPPEYLCKKGDLIVAMTEQAAGLLGSTALVPVDNLFLHNQRIGLFDIDEKEYDILFLNYLFRLKYIRQQIALTSSGTKVKHTSPERIYQVKCLKPPLIIQKSIGTLLHAIDKKIEHNNRINAELESMAKLIYDYWFVQFDFPDEKGRPYKSTGGKMVYNEKLKREIPEGWEDGVLDDIATIVGGSTPSKTNDDNFTVDDGTPWITPKDLSLKKGKKFITRGELDVTDLGIKDASLKIMPGDTVLLSSRAPIGYMAISRENTTTNQGFKSFISDKGYSNYFIFYTVKNLVPAMHIFSSGSTFKEISAKDLKSFKTVIPPINVRELFTKQITSIFVKQDLLELENEKLRELRDWLLPMLMNGQVKMHQIK